MAVRLRDTPLTAHAGSVGDFRLTPTQHAALFGDHDPVKLGCGSFACTYDHADPHRVVKITSDPEDAAASLRLRRIGPHPHLAAIYGVRRLAAQAVYAVTAERLKKPSQEDRWLQDCAFDMAVNGMGWQPSQADERNATVFARTCRLRGYPETVTDEAMTEYMRDIRSARDALAEAGITWSDIRPGNVMRKNGRWAAMDYGVSGVDSAEVDAAEPLAGARRGFRVAQRWRGWR